MTNFNIFLREGKWFGNEFPDKPNTAGQGYSTMEESRILGQHSEAVERAKSEALEVENPEIAGFECIDGYWLFDALITMVNHIKPGVLYPWDGGWEVVERQWELLYTPEKVCYECLNNVHENCTGCSCNHKDTPWWKKERILLLLPKSPVKDRIHEMAESSIKLRGGSWGQPIEQKSGPLKNKVSAENAQPGGIVANGVLEQPDFITAIEAAYMDRIITTLIQKWNCDYKHARDIGRDIFYTYVLPVYELGGQFGLKPKSVEPSLQAESDVLLWLEEERNILQNSATLMWHERLQQENKELREALKSMCDTIGTQSMISWVSKEYESARKLLEP